MQHSLSPMIADGGAVTEYFGTSVADILVNIAHIAKSLTAQAGTRRIQFRTG
jgi:hypothetical protein